jgi:MYXO-CTERM domain-containing protein
MRLANTLRITVAALVLVAGSATAQQPTNKSGPPTDTKEEQQLENRTGSVVPENAPKWNPGFADQVPNRELSGNTPQTNSTLQETRKDFSTSYFGWLGLLGLAGLFGLSRGSNPRPGDKTR